MKNEASKFYDDLMEAACDLCHRPYIETDQEALDMFCEENCPVNKIASEYLRMNAETEAQCSE